MSNHFAFDLGLCTKRKGALLRCKAHSLWKCLSCVRRMKKIEPVEWDGIQGWNVPGGSIQYIKTSEKPLPWSVVVFWSGRKVDPRFPIISCSSRQAAMKLAHKRARQVLPHTVTKKWCDEEAWSRGGLLILEAREVSR